MDCRKRKLSVQQPSCIPVMTLKPEPAPQPSSHLATGGSDDVYLDDDFFEGLGLDAIKAQATEQWKQRTAQPTQKLVEPKKASEGSFAPPSFDLGF
jgi:fanconi anemia group M protein